jgi:hypothetical protein
MVPRKKGVNVTYDPDAAVTTNLKQPFVVAPLATYRPDHVRAGLGLAKHTIMREIRQKRLRVSKRAGRYFILGEWVIEWLREGELKRA